MPYPNEHHARINDPDKYPKKRRENDKFGPGISVIWGVLSDGKTEVQAIIFDAKKFTPAQAKKWCKEHDKKVILFESATGEEKSKEPKMEYRNFELMEIRSAEENGQKILRGLAIPYGKEGEFFGIFRERIEKGALTKTLKDGDQIALWCHDRTKPLGRRSSGTLILNDTDEGLRFQINLPQTSWGNDAWESVRRGDVKGVSFGFESVRGKTFIDTSDVDKPPLRIIREMKLNEISPVPDPFYEMTTIEARSILEMSGYADQETTCEPEDDHSMEEPVEDHSEADFRSEWLEKELWFENEIMKGY